MQTAGTRPIEQYIEPIPGIIFVHDDIRSPKGTKYHSGYDTFLKTLNVVQGSDAVHMEDDAVLGKNFYERCLAEIYKRPEDIIQFFSRRQDDLRIGSRYIAGGAFSFNVCWYVPKKHSEPLYEYAKGWGRREEHPTGFDTVVADYMTENRLNYWNVVPNIVDHAEGESCIDRRRARRRISLTFEQGEREYVSTNR